MKLFTLTAILGMILSQLSLAEDTYVDTYVRSDGVVVDGYNRSDNDGDPANNFDLPSANEMADYYIRQQQEQDNK